MKLWCELAAQRQLAVIEGSKRVRPTTWKRHPIEFMFRFSLSNMLLAIVPLGVGFWCVRELVRGNGIVISILLLAGMCAMLAAAIGALLNGRQGLQRGLIMGTAAAAFVGIGSVVCVAVILLLLFVAASFA